jgi:hypothetical protein
MPLAAQPTELEVFMSPQQYADEKMLLEQVLRQLLPEEVTPLVNPDKRAIAVVHESGSSQNIIEFFTSSEWNVLQKPFSESPVRVSRHIPFLRV